MVGIEVFSGLGVFVLLFLLVRSLFKEGRVYVFTTLIISSIICVALSYDSQVFISAFLGWFVVIPIPVAVLALITKLSLKNA
ncbi:hypothetical protein [Paraglaciecola sp. 25GB23A]|jgi:hypothetical protein|uniref:hypothetical protein n=1 Tax=Paraglaciecola sp. 25GB23A TaxID=3156068 RepID=UPI0032AF07E3